MTTTTPLTNPTAQLSRQVHRAQTREAARALARLTPQAQNRGLTQTILDAASTKTAAAAQATTLAKAQLAEAELQAWLKDMDARLEVILAHPEQNLGEIEEQLARSVKEPLRLLAQRAAQVKANAVPCRCPECHGQLQQQLPPFRPQPQHRRPDRGRDQTRRGDPDRVPRPRASLAVGAPGNAAESPRTRRPADAHSPPRRLRPPPPLTRHRPHRELKIFCARLFNTFQPSAPGPPHPACYLEI